MTLTILTLALAFGWALATGTFSLINLLFGGVLGAVGLWLLRDHVASPMLVPRLRRITSLVVLFIAELFLSAFRMARLSLSPGIESKMNPAIIAFPLTVKRDAEITLLANLITLTPGTLSIGVSEDKQFLYIHAINAGDRAAFIAEIADGFEKKVREVFE